MRISVGYFNAEKPNRITAEGLYKAILGQLEFFDITDRLRGTAIDYDGGRSCDEDYYFDAELDALLEEPYELGAWDDYVDDAVDYIDELLYDTYDRLMELPEQKQRKIYNILLNWLQTDHDMADTRATAYEIKAVDGELYYAMVGENHNLIESNYGYYMHGDEAEYVALTWVFLSLLMKPDTFSDYNIGERLKIVPASCRCEDIYSFVESSHVSFEEFLLPIIFRVYFGNLFWGSPRFEEFIRLDRGYFADRYSDWIWENVREAMDMDGCGDGGRDLVYDSLEDDELTGIVHVKVLDNENIPARVMYLVKTAGPFAVIKISYDATIQTLRIMGYNTHLTGRGDVDSLQPGTIRVELDKAEVSLYGMFCTGHFDSGKYTEEELAELIVHSFLLDADDEQTLFINDERLDNLIYDMSFNSLPSDYNIIFDKRLDAWKTEAIKEAMLEAIKLLLFQDEEGKKRVAERLQQVQYPTGE